MAHDIIMPMLGMAQDTGIIVAWKKKPGDAVKASDILMEVETDKSTVEVEAGHDGYLAAIRAGIGMPIPVGDVVAVISSDPGEVDTAPSSAVLIKAHETTTPAVERPAEDVSPAKPLPAPTPTPLPTAMPRPAGGKVLASPKARREAEARGLDLGRLVRLGVPEPIHVADLDKAGATGASTTRAGAAATGLMRVRVERTPFDAFLAWLADDAGLEVDSLHVWAAFAAGSLRSASGVGHDAEIVVNAGRFPGSDLLTLKNPDRRGLSDLEAEAPGGIAALTVLDLTDTPLTEYRPAGERPLPYLTVANGQDPDSLDIYLEFDPGTLEDATAFDFLKNLADRAHTPLRHLL